MRRLIQRSLAVIDKSKPAVFHVHAEVPFVGHQQNAGSFMNMAVVVNIDQQMILHCLFLYPVMENRNEFLQRNCGEMGDEELDTEPMAFHSLDRCRQAASLGEPIMANVCRFDEELSFLNRAVSLIVRVLLGRRRVTYEKILREFASHIFVEKETRIAESLTELVNDGVRFVGNIEKDRKSVV